MKTTRPFQTRFLILSLLLGIPACVRASTIDDVTVSVQGQAVMTSCQFDPAWCTQHLGTVYRGGWMPDFTFHGDDPMTSFDSGPLAVWSNPVYGSLVFLTSAEFVDRGEGCPDCRVWTIQFDGDWLPGDNLAPTDATGTLTESLFSGRGSATYSFSGTISVSGASQLVTAEDADPPAPEPATLLYLGCAGVMLGMWRRWRHTTT